MNLSFDNLEEFDRFLRWADLYRMAGTPEPGVSGSACDASALDTAALVASSAADRMAPFVAAGLAVAGDLSGDTGSSERGRVDRASEEVNANGEKKRKRRTKAEIEADERAARDAALVADQATADKASCDAALARVAAATDPAPTGANPFEQPAAGGTEGAAAPAADAGTEADAEEAVTPFQHLTRAREFIAKHGMPKYNETFAKASLDPNVMAYTAYQRALHMTAMDELDKA